MTEVKESTKKNTPKIIRRERLFALAQANYKPRKATRWPYLLRGEQKFRFEGPDKKSLRADLRALWREKHPGENTPSDPELNSVIDDLKRLAEKADPDEPTAEETANQLLDARGISVIPDERGLDLVTCLSLSTSPGGRAGARRSRRQRD